jgi:spermidine synthase
MPAPLQQRGIALLAFALFALSGFSGLIYQAIWAQYLGLYLGHAAYAQSLVLAIFMGGMALGAWSVSRWGGSLPNLLRTYAVVELVIGVAGVLFHGAFVGVTEFALDSALPALPGPLGSAFKWTSGALLILPQAILLGSTFPLMSNALIRRRGAETGAVLSTLYFTNSIGAAAGALTATFVLLPAVGLPGAMRAGALVNVLVALIAFAASRRTEAAAAGSQQARPGASAAIVPGARLLLFAAAITGATSFVYEIGWVRMLAMALGSTLHAFELMLAAFIGGLAMGGLWIRRRIDGYADPVRAGGWVQILMGLAALASLLLYDRSFDWVAWFLQALQRTAAGYDLYHFATATVAIAIMAPAAFFAGMTLPLFTLALLRSGGGEPAVGRIYAANTLGAIVGVMLAVHVLLPAVGLKLSMVLAAVFDLLVGLLLLRPAVASASARWQRPVYLGAIALCLVATALATRFARFDPAAMSAGVYRNGVARHAAQSVRVLYFRDGKTASVGVIEGRDGVRSIVTNGKSDAGAQMHFDARPAGDEYTMVLAAMLPLSLHPDPKEVANIGFGSGLTVHHLLSDPRVQRLDTIEIEPAMYEGARLFMPLNRRAYDDPRARIHFEDAKTYFASTSGTYDVIVSEPSNPWVAGVATLFSREFYRFLPRHLKPGGLFVQWVQLYEIDEPLVASIVNALDESFSDYRIYLSGSGDLLLVARADGELTASTQFPSLDAASLGVLRRLQLDNADGIDARLVGDRRTLAPMMAALSRGSNSDFHPRVALESPRTRFQRTSATFLADLGRQDIPVVEVMMGRTAAPTPIEPARRRLLPGDRTEAAYAIARLLLDDAPDARASSYSMTTAVVQQALVGCDGRVPDAALLESLHVLFSATLSHLDLDTAGKLWGTPDWPRCEPAAPSVAAVLALYSAAARRDWPAVVAQAPVLLETHQAVLPKPQADQFLRLAMLGAIATQDYAAVAALPRRLDRIAPPVGKDGFLRRLHMQAFAAAELARAGAARPP